MSGSEPIKEQILAGTPAVLSRQLGIDVHEILAAIDAASLAPSVNTEGDAVYDLKAVITAVVEQKRVFDVAQDPKIKSLIRDCVLSSAESIRHFIKEENKTAYQIKQMTESRFVEVLGQVGVSLGRLEAFMAQATRIMHQLDARLSSFERSQQSRTEGVRVASEEGSSGVHGEASDATKVALESGQETRVEVNQSSSHHLVVQGEYLSNSQHWRMFESYLSQILGATGAMSDSSRSDWFKTVKKLIGMGSLEVRVEGDPLIAAISPALMNHFTPVVNKLPKESEVLPFFEDYYDWVKVHLAEGYPAILLYLIVLCNRGGQMSWLGFLSTFINEG